MALVAFTKTLKDEYQRLFDVCIIHEEEVGEVESILSKMVDNKARYEAVAQTLTIPWFFVAVIHNMEASMNFERHLHNGDPLSARTVNEPKGRPASGDPPFTWEESVLDALKMKQLPKWEEWNIPGMLYQLEKYNGWGYRRFHPHVLTPYLWSGSNHYTEGKYVADGTWSETAASGQIGAAVLLRRMAEHGTIESFESYSAPLAEARPLLRFLPDEQSAHSENLQKFLNTFPGIYVKADGYAGKKTSEAFRKVTGFYLNGDPRT